MAHESNPDEAKELAGRLNVLACCAALIPDLLAGEADSDLNLEASPLKEHLHRVQIYGTPERWREVSAMSAALAMVVTVAPSEEDDPAVRMALDALEMIKPDFQAHPGLMRKLYGFDQVSTGGPELHAFGIDGERRFCKD